MIVLVKSKAEVQFGDYTNLEVKGTNTKTGKETTCQVYSALSEKWSLVQEGQLVELVMQNKGTKEQPKWQVTDIKAILSE